MIYPLIKELKSLSETERLFDYNKRIYQDSYIGLYFKMLGELKTNRLFIS